MTEGLGLYRSELVGLKPRGSLESLASPLSTAPVITPIVTYATFFGTTSSVPLNIIWVLFVPDSPVSE